jgi:hypothetical protein
LISSFALSKSIVFSLASFSPVSLQLEEINNLVGLVTVSAHPIAMFVNDMSVRKGMSRFYPDIVQALISKFLYGF